MYDVGDQMVPSPGRDNVRVVCYIVSRRAVAFRSGNKSIGSAAQNSVAADILSAQSWSLDATAVDGRTIDTDSACK